MIIKNNTKDGVAKKTIFLPDKKKIAQNFNKAVQSYDKSDEFQSCTAKHLLTLLPKNSSLILDLGCGTGKWTQFLYEHYKHASIFGIDLADKMLLSAKKKHNSKINWLNADIEHLPFNHNIASLIYSNMAIQWCESFKNVIDQTFKVLIRGGYFIFSTLIKDSLKELNYAWNMLDTNEHVNKYNSLKFHLDVCNSSPFSIEYHKVKQETFYYNNTQDLVREFKELGVNTVVHYENKGLMPPSRYKRFLSRYESLRTENGIPCGYNVLYMVLKKNKNSANM